MKNLNDLNEFRKPFYGELGDEKNGFFIIPSNNKYYYVIVGTADNWEHVSVTIHTQNGELVKRCPKWSKMCMIKELFFEDDEVVMQLHPKKEEYINNHPYCLHLWKPQNIEIPTPPSYMVGNKKYTLNME